METLPGIFVKIMLVAALGVLAYYGWLVMQNKKVVKEVAEIKAEHAQNIATAMNLKKRDEVLTRQAQLKEFNSLLAGHLYWSNVLPELAKVTLKYAKYTNLRASADGTLELGVTVPTLDDLDKYLQVFDQAKFNENFSDIRIGGFSKVTDETGSQIKFDARMKYNGNLLKYSEAK